MAAVGEAAVGGQSGDVVEHRLGEAGEIAHTAKYIFENDFFTGRVVEIDGDYTETLARLAANKNGVGVFGLAFYENNKDKLRVAEFKGVTPSRETVASGKYKVSRPLFMYVKMQHVGTIPGLKEFVQFFVSDEVAGPGGPLEAYGLVPDPELAKTQKKVEADKTM